MRGRVLLAAAVVLVLLAGGVVAVLAWNRAHRTDLERAIDRVPVAAKRVAFTDWAAVRRSLGVSTSSDPDAAVDWLGRAYDADLSAASSIDGATAALQQHYGFSPRNARWEAYAQSDDGAAMVLRLDDGVDFDDLAANLARIGYREPAEDDGVWDGGIDLVAGLDRTLTPELQYVVLLREDHLVITSDTDAYAASAASVARGEQESLAGVDSVESVVGTVGEPAAAVLWSRDFACADLAMSQADAADRSRAEELIAEAGGIDPLTGLVMALAPDRTLTVAEQFASADTARDNLRPRARLAVGEAVGRGASSFADDLRLTGSRTEDATVLLTLEPVGDGVFPLSSLYDGAVLFATC